MLCHVLLSQTVVKVLILLFSRFSMYFELCTRNVRRWLLCTRVWTSEHVRTCILIINKPCNTTTMITTTTGREFLSSIPLLKILLIPFIRSSYCFLDSQTAFFMRRLLRPNRLSFLPSDPSHVLFAQDRHCEKRKGWKQKEWYICWKD